MRRRLSGVLLLFAVMCTVVVTACTDRGRAATKDPKDAKDNRVVWVFFRDSASYDGSDARSAISGYTLDQRARYRLPALQNDRPLPQRLVARVIATGAVLREQSRWLRAISVSADDKAIRRILAMHEVARIRDVATLVRAGNIAGASETVAAVRHVAGKNAVAFDSAYYGPNWYGIQQMDIPGAQLAGFDGSGVRIALFDTGFLRSHEALIGRQVVAQRDFINNDANVADQPGDSDVAQQRHGTQVWSIIGGLSPGLVVGPANGAQFLLAKVDREPGDTKADEDRWVAAMEWADSVGVQIISSSVALRWNFSDRIAVPYDSLDGNSFAITRAADEAARRGHLVIQAMGDAPTPDPGTLSAPADADSIIAVGSVDRFGNTVGFNPGYSGRGPTADGRTKPDLVAYGTGMNGAGQTDRSYDGRLAGTSYSTALITAGAALFLQAWPDLYTAPMAVRRALQLSASTTTHPDNTVGWGVPDIGGAILFPEGIALNAIVPSDINGAATSIAPTFSWSISKTNTRMHPVTYRVQVATDTGFTDVVFTDTVREGLSLTAKSPLPPSPRLFWRVVATTQVGVRRASFPDQFHVPDWVTLATFAGEQATFSNTTQPELIWVPLQAGAAGPFTYDVQVLANGTNTIVQNIKGLTTSTVRVPEPLTPNQSFRWRVIVHAHTGQVDTVSSVEPFVIATDDRPPVTTLYQNFPNPFPNLNTGVSTTHVWFDLAADGPVQLSVYDTRGVVVKHLIPSPGCSPVVLTAGIYGRSGGVLGANLCVNLDWDGTNDSGATVPGGIYILRLNAAGSSLTRKIVFAPNR